MVMQLMHVIIVLRNMNNLPITMYVMCLDKKALPVPCNVETFLPYTGVFAGIMIAGIGLMSVL